MSFFGDRNNAEPGLEFVNSCSYSYFRLSNAMRTKPIKKHCAMLYEETMSCVLVQGPEQEVRKEEPCHARVAISLIALIGEKRSRLLLFLFLSTNDSWSICFLCLCSLSTHLLFSLYLKFWDIVLRTCLVFGVAWSSFGI